MDYWDTSAILKLYVAEHDSTYFLRLIAEINEPILSSAIVTTEVLCALYRKQRAGDLKEGGANTIFRKFNADLRAGRIVTIPYGADVEAGAEKLIRLAFHDPGPVLIRSLDAIHIASALVGNAKRLVATDARLREAASLVGLKVLP